MEERSTSGLHKNVNKAAAIRNMCQTPGFQILKEEFKAKIEKATKKILDADTSDEEVTKLRQDLRIWTDVEKMLKELMLKGELCKRALDQLDNLNQTSPEEKDKEK